MRDAVSKENSQIVVTSHAFGPSNGEEAKTGRSLCIENSLVYRVSSRTARATQRNPVSKTTLFLPPKKAKGRQREPKLGKRHSNTSGVVLMSMCHSSLWP